MPKAVSRHFRYIRRFIAAPRTFGSLAPSSPWLCRKMMAEVPWEKTVRIAELGAADGVLTKRILKNMRSDAHLDAYEIQPELADKLRLIDDGRLSVFDTAARLNDDYDAVFSCLPLLSLPLHTGMRILHQVAGRLTPGGIFVQFQYSPLSERMLSRCFRWHKVYEMRNIPPAWVYVCTPLNPFAGTSADHKSAPVPLSAIPEKTDGMI